MVYVCVQPVCVCVCDASDRFRSITSHPTTCYRARRTYTDTNNSLGIKLNTAAVGILPRRHHRLLPPPPLHHHFPHRNMSICIWYLLFDCSMCDRKRKQWKKVQMYGVRECESTFVKGTLPIKRFSYVQIHRNRFRFSQTELYDSTLSCRAHATRMWHQAKHLHKLAACIIIEGYKILIGNGNLPRSISIQQPMKGQLCAQRLQCAHHTPAESKQHRPHRVWLLRNDLDKCFIRRCHL